MKKYFIYISLAIGSVFSSCSEYLTVDSLSSFDADYVFSSAEDAYKVLLSAYACFPTDAYTSRMSCVFQQNTDVEAANGVSDARDGSRRDVWSLEPQASFADMTTCWNMCYLAIDRANQCIEGISASDLYKAGDESMKQLLGEAYCMRAYWYYLLINFYGDVPAALEASKADMQLDNPRTDKNIIYTELIQNLIDHEADMKWAEDLDGGIERMNREFALGMIARLSLFRAGYSMQSNGTMQRDSDEVCLEYYQKAKDACQKLISLKDRELNSSFKQIFLNECQYLSPENDDILYEVAFVQSKGGDVGWCIGVSTESGDLGSGSSYVQFPGTYYYSFDEKDTRFPVTCAQYKYTDVVGSTCYEDAQSFNGTTPGKWSRAWSTADLGSSSTKGTGINWPVMRYSDILLMLAEAENELNGPTTVAVNALKRVRNRAFEATDRSEKVEAYVDSVAATGTDAFFNAIVDERAWEFGGECLRRFDLIRWNLYGPKIIAVKQGLISMGLAANAILPGDSILENYKDENGVVGAPSFYTTEVYNKYANYANKLYYRKLLAGSVDNVNGTTLEWYNTHWKVAAPAIYNATTNTNPEGYTALTWASSGVKVTGDTLVAPADWVKRSYRGYTVGTSTSQINTMTDALTYPVPYLLPIGSTVINASEVLTNDGYGFKNL
jgi:starch-binding outer membrane protein, SusD/RagB family